MNKRALNLLAIFLAVALIGGCKSVPDKVKELADNSYFQEASTVIATEQEKLSTNPDLDKIRELERARELFEERVAAHFNEQIAKLDSEGKVRGALKAAEEAFRLCPWSDRIKSTLAVCETRVAVLDKVEAKWSRQISSGEIAPSESREALSDLAGLLSSLSDSPNLLQLQSIAFQGAVAFWAGRLTETKLHLRPRKSLKWMSTFVGFLLMTRRRRRLKELLDPSGTSTKQTRQMLTTYHSLLQLYTLTTRTYSLIPERRSSSECFRDRLRAGRSMALSKYLLGRVFLSTL